MQARDLMQEDVLTVAESDPIEELLDVLVAERIHGAPVVNSEGDLVGVVTQQDLVFGSMMRPEASKPGDSASPVTRGLEVRDIMTSPAVSATEDTDIRNLCRIMYQLRIHRVPIVRGAKVRGIVSSLDVCNAVAEGKAAG